MKNTELIRLMADFVANSNNGTYVREKAKECIDQITEQMDREAEQKAIKAEQMLEATSASVGGVDQEKETPVIRSKELVRPTGQPKKMAGKNKKVDVEKIKVLREGGWSVKKIAEEMKVSEPTIYSHMRKEGIK